MQKRIEEFECRMAFYEDLVESLNQQVTQLSLQMHQQQEAMKVIAKELEAMRKSMSNLGQYSLAEEIPPHY